MKRRNLLLLIVCTLLGGVLTSANSLNTGVVNLKADSLSHQHSSDYTQRQRNIHARILRMYPGTYLDSMNIVIHLLSDSIRKDLSRTKIKDSIAYLNTCLNSTLKDSVLLERLGKFLIEKEQPILNSNGIFTVHCMDASNSFSIDSIAMDVFSGNSLITSAISDSLGIIRMLRIPDGTYSMVFSRRGYTPVSLTYTIGVNKEQSTLEIPLRKQSGYLAQMVSKNGWLCLTTGIILLLVIMSVFAYFMAKLMVKKQNRKVK